jgi:hypothetical protein
VRYASESGVLLAQGVTAVWALEDHPDAADAASVTIIPASHKANFPTPAAVLSGERSVRTAVRLLLRAGDLLLLATPMLWRYSDAEQRLLLADYTPTSVFPSGGYAPPPPSPEATAWLSELTPEARAVVEPRLLGGGGGWGTGGGGEAGGGRETLQSDGQRMWMGNAVPAPAVAVPPGLTADEAWEWDLNGFLVVLALDVKVILIPPCVFH